MNHARKDLRARRRSLEHRRGFFSLLKRGIAGVYHHVGRGHLGRYVDEFSFRHNARTMSDGDRAALLVLGADRKRLMYRD